MMRRLLSGGIGVLALVFTAVGGPNAGATTFAELTVEQFTDASTWIVEGDVTAVWTELDTEREVVWTRARVTVTDTLKGRGVPTEVVVDSLGGAVGDYSVHVPGQAQFSVGEHVLVFLDDLDDDGTRMVPVSKFLGKYSLRRAAGDTAQHAMVWHPKKGVAFDHRFLPHPAPEHRLSADDLRSQVRSRVEIGWDGKPIAGLSPERLQRINAAEMRIPR